MSMRNRGSEAVLTPLLELAQRELHGEAPRLEAASFERLELTRKRRVLGWLRLATPGLALACVVLLWLWHRVPEPLAMHVEHGTLASSGEVSAPAGARLRFSDGTRLRVDADSRVRVEAVSSHGADVRLRSGRVRLDVVKRGGADWSVRAGGYRVAVTGTSFSVELDDSEHLSVDLFAGSVIVTGPLAPSGLPVNAGQRLSVEPASGRVRLLPLSEVESGPGAAVGSELAGSELAGETVEPALVADVGLAAEAEPDVEATPRPRVRSRPQVAQPAARTAGSWPSRVAAGDFRAVLVDAERMGLESVFHAAEREDLQALADAARYARQAAVARGALSALRRRFAGSSRAVQAAFFLGRLAEAEGEAGEAVAWYGSYLVKEPTGAYAAEALGRKLAIVTRQGGGAAATALAAEYLQRFPRGPHAGLARRHAGSGASGP